MGSSPILLYHRIVAGTPIDIHSVSRDAFRQQMHWLNEQGYTSATIDELVQPDGVRPGRRRITISFDDGYLDALTTALPILMDYNFTAVIFLVAERIGKVNDWDDSPELSGARLMDWNHLEEMARNGISFGSHSCTHPNLVAIPARQAEEEIRDSRTILEQMLQKPIPVFSYPYSQFSEAIMNMVSENGYRFACTYTPGYVGNPGKTHYRLQRTGILATDTLEDFISKVQARLRWRIRYIWRVYRHIGIIRMK